MEPIEMPKANMRAADMNAPHKNTHGTEAGAAVDNEDGPKKRPGNTGALLYDRLRADIVKGTLAPGTPLSQAAIAQSAGISRGPVNDALRRLQQDKLVIAGPNKRFNVAPFDIADLEAVFCLYMANNALAVQISVPHLTDEDIRHLESCVDLIDRSFEKDAAQWDSAYHDLLFTIIRHSSVRSVALARQLVDEIHRYQAVRPGPRSWIKGSEFREVIGAARKKNGLVASLRYAELIGRQGCQVMARIAPTYDASRLRQYILKLAPLDVSK
jgi:DNA-binding GntR family transcriptional regulator